MSHPASRVLAMLELLQAHHRLTGRELARRLRVDGRTVRRYAGTLAELGVPVVAERGRYGGYRLAPGYKLPPLMLTDDEAVAVVLGLLAAERLGLRTSAPAIDGARAKLDRVLPAALRERTRAVGETLGFTQPPREARAPAADVLLTLGDAVRRRRRVRLGYTSWRGEQSERELDPYGVVFHAGRWYVVGHDHRRGAQRTFRLDRITAARPLDAQFAPPPGFDPIAEVTDSLARVPYAVQVEVLLHTTREQARRRIGPAVGTLIDRPDGVLLRSRAERLDGMAQLLAGLGWRFTVLAPDDLRAEVRALAARLSADAGPDG